MTLVTILGVILDGLIFVWLVFTWFYEGHHKRCQVEVLCSNCNNKTIHSCSAITDDHSDHDMTHIKDV